MKRLFGFWSFLLVIASADFSTPTLAQTYDSEQDVSIVMSGIYDKKTGEALYAVCTKIVVGRVGEACTELNFVRIEFGRLNKVKPETLIASVGQHRAVFSESISDQNLAQLFQEIQTSATEERRDRLSKKHDPSKNPFKFTKDAWSKGEYGFTFLGATVAGAVSGGVISGQRSDLDEPAIDDFTVPKSVGFSDSYRISVFLPEDSGFPATNNTVIRKSAMGLVEFAQLFDAAADSGLGIDAFTFYGNPWIYTDHNSYMGYDTYVVMSQVRLYSGIVDGLNALNYFKNNPHLLNDPKLAALYERFQSGNADFNAAMSAFDAEKAKREEMEKQAWISIGATLGGMLLTPVAMDVVNNAGAGIARAEINRKYQSTQEQLDAAWAQFFVRTNGVLAKENFIEVTPDVYKKVYFQVASMAERLKNPAQ